MSKGNPVRKQMLRRYQQIESHILQILGYIDDIMSYIPDVIDQYRERFELIQFILIEVADMLRALRDEV